VQKEDAKTPPKTQKEIKKELKKEAKSKSIPKIKIGPAVQKKRLFSVTSIKQDREKMLVIKKGKEEEELKSLLDIVSLSALVLKEEEDRVAYRTRKRHTLRLEDLERSAEFELV